MKYNIIKCLIIVSILIKPLLSFADIKMLNVSYDPTRELYQEYNQAFSKYWFNKTGQKVLIDQSHGASGKQARSVIDGIEADIVTLALAYDINAISKSELIDKNWQAKFKNNSAPYTSTIVLLVRKNNPKKIKDWNDLIRNDIEVLSPNPKTSGGARWGYTAAWTYALKKFNNDENKTREFVSKIFNNVKVLDSGARGSLISFTQRNMGDVLISWENEAYLAKKNKDNFDIILPSVSILAEPSVAIVDKVAKKHNTTQIANAYLDYLYSDEGQNIAAKNFYRPTNPAILVKYNTIFKPIKLYSIQEIFGSWDNAHKKHFANGAIFDQIMLNRNLK